MAQLIGHHLKALHKSSQDEVLKIQQRVDGQARNQKKAPWRKAKTTDEEAVIPDPDLFDALELLPDADVNALPKPCECAVHLGLLEVFRALQVYILCSTELDTTFGIALRKRTVYRQRYSYEQQKSIREPVQLKDITIQERRARKWSYYLNLAATRFKIWATKVDNEISARSRKEGAWADGQKSVLPYLPPLDILVIWHAFLLNPLYFADYCRNYGLHYLSKVPFPWPQIHDAIDPKDLSYTLPKESSNWLSSSANLEPDLLQYLIDAGKAPNAATPILSRFGEQTSTPISPPIMSRAELLDMNAPPREWAFLEALQASEDQKALNGPLVSNVQRQGTFVDKMHAHLWIRSPAVEGTLRRAVDRYDKFLQLFMLYPRRRLVPTLDIDLAWHTHQLSAARYAAATRARAGKFINHDDKLGKEPLEKGMSLTKDLFRERFGLEYSVCLCWDCEAAASALELGDQDNMLDGSSFDELVDRVQQDLDYYRAVELARRQRQPLPVRLV